MAKAAPVFTFAARGRDARVTGPRKDGSKGLSPATALKKAQEFVAGHEKWKHPYYWAAWQLWELGD